MSGPGGQAGGVGETVRRLAGTARMPSARNCAAAVRQLRRQIIFSHPLLDFDRLLVNKCPPPALFAPVAAIPGPLQPAGPGAGGARILEGPAAGVAALERQAAAGHGDAPRPVVRRPPRRVRVLRSYAAGPELAAVLPLGGGRRRQPPAPAHRDPCGPDGRGGRPRDRRWSRISTPAICPTAESPSSAPGRRPTSAASTASVTLPTSCSTAPTATARTSGRSRSPRPRNGNPSVLDDGRILYSRWDYTNRHSYHFQSLWVTRPDGTGTANVYGNLTRNPCNTGEPRPVPGSHKIVCTATAHHGYTAGSIILVDPRKGIDGLSPHHADHARDRLPGNGRLAGGRLRHALSAQRGPVPGGLHAGPLVRGRQRAERSRLRHLSGG